MTAIRVQTIIIKPRSNFEIEILSAFAFCIFIALSWFIFKILNAKKMPKKKSSIFIKKCRYDGDKISD